MPFCGGDEYSCFRCHFKAVYIGFVVEDSCRQYETIVELIDE
jgi:hypothetical protein